ncbi:MAG: 23S rRNA (pseudouridine(1915)-N(3))-methyltransferase RlmH, partial [Traorella sp.]
NEYIKRLSPYTSVEVIEVADELPQANTSLKDEENCRIKEGERVLSKIKDSDYVYLLDLHGKQVDSISFAHDIENLMNKGNSTITFIIGGSTGVSPNLIQRANFRLCLSTMTFTHLMTRGILLEQIYRAFTIINNKTYHK